MTAELGSIYSMGKCLDLLLNSPFRLACSASVMYTKKLKSVASTPPPLTPQSRWIMTTIAFPLYPYLFFAYYTGASAIREVGPPTQDTLPAHQGEKLLNKNMIFSRPMYKNFSYQGNTA